MFYSVFMRYLMVFVTLFMVGCAKGPNHIDPAFQGFYDQFIVDANAHGKSMPHDQGITIKFVDDLKFNVVGLCQGGDTISILRFYWDSLEENKDNIEGKNAAEKALIYHELGHCILGRSHTTDTRSLMQDGVAGPFYVVYTSLEDGLNELFH